MEARREGSSKHRKAKTGRADSERMGSLDQKEFGTYEDDVSGPDMYFQMGDSRSEKTQRSVRGCGRGAVSGWTSRLPSGGAATQANVRGAGTPEGRDVNRHGFRSVAICEKR